MSEFIGTYLLVLTVGCNVLGGSPIMAGLSIASVLMVSVYALGSVSGACFNPAVTLCLAFAKTAGFDAAKVCGYIVTQLIAGALAGVTYGWIFGKTVNLAPVGDFSWTSVMAVEVLYTFMLCFVVLRSAVSNMNPAENEYFGLAIGFVIVAGAYGAGSISMGAFNPAVAFGLDISSAGQGFHWCIWYSIFEIVGALFAAIVHSMVEEPTAGSSGALSKGARCFVSEFLGTFFLVLTVGLNVTGGSPAGALSIGASLMCMIYALGGVSGAHFNPAVTTTLLLTKNCDFAGTWAPYVASQVAGGLAAGVSYTTLTGKGVPLAPGTGHSMMSVAFAEIIATFVLCFVVLNVAASKEGKSEHMFGLAIGFCIVAMGNAIGAVSGGSLNPAVSIGLDGSDAMKGGSFGNSAMYSLFELVGAGAAAGAYYVCRPEEFAKQGLFGKVEKPNYGIA